MWDLTIDDGIILAVLGWLLYQEYKKHGCFAKMKTQFQAFVDEIKTKLKEANDLHSKLDDRIRDLEKKD